MELSPNQLSACQLLATGLSFKTVSEELSIDRKTLYAWRQKPYFKARLNAEKQVIQDQVRNRLRSLLSKSIDRLDGLVDAPDDQIALKAVSMVLNYLPDTNDILSDNPDHHRPSYIGVTIPDSSLERLTQQVLVILETYVAGNYSLKEIKRLLGCNLTMDAAEVLISNNDLLENFCRKLLPDECIEE